MDRVEELADGEETTKAADGPTKPPFRPEPLMLRRLLVLLARAFGAGCILYAMYRFNWGNIELLCIIVGMLLLWIPIRASTR